MKEGKKITRSRNGCFTCKKRRRKCDETKPHCKNCTSTGRHCLGYGIKLVFDVDDSRNNNNIKHLTPSGKQKFGFVGRPRISSTTSFINTNSNNIHNSSNNSVRSKNIANVPRDLTVVETSLNKQPKISNNVALTPITPINILDNSVGDDESLIKTPINEKTKIETLLNPSSFIPTIMNTTSTVSSSDKDELDILDDPQQFETAFLSGLDYILDNYDNELLNTLDLPLLPNTSNSNNNNNDLIISSETSLNPSSNNQNTTVNFTNTVNTANNNISLDNNQIIQQDLDSNELGTQLKKKEESHILKHFFEKVVFLLDAHPQSPWPSLMMKFGSMELAKSCFLSLSSMHLYVNNGGDEFYKKGLLHINNTMEYLIKYVKTNSSNDDELDVPKIISKIKSESSSNKRKSTTSNTSNTASNNNNNNNNNNKTNFIVILLLLYVHLLFAVLESGRSALARMFLKLSASIASDPIFNKKLKKIKQSQSLLCVLSWFDTVSAIVSPDCRLPYCDPKWFGESNDLISTDNMNGCPVGIFRILYDLAIYRNEIMLLFQQNEIQLSNLKQFFKKLMDLKDRCLHYRDHVLFVLPHGSSFTYIERLKCAQLWSLSAILLIIQIEHHYFKKLSLFIEHNRNIINCSEFPTNIPQIHIYSNKSTAIVSEFLSVYNTIPSNSPIITQMVWPIFYVAVCSSTLENKNDSWKSLSTLYDTVKMGTIKSLMDITERVWKEGVSVEYILGGEGWLEAGIDMLPC